MLDEDRFIEMALDKTSVEFMGGATGIEEKESAMFHRIFRLYEQNNKRWFWIWGIYKKEQLCGHLELKETEHTDKNELEIVYMMHPQERRKGIMTKVLSFIKAQQPNWQRRIIATVNPTNMHSIILLEKWGIDKREECVDPEDGKPYLKLTLSA